MEYGTNGGAALLAAVRQVSREILAGQRATFLHFPHAELYARIEIRW